MDYLLWAGNWTLYSRVLIGPWLFSIGKISSRKGSDLSALTFGFRILDDQLICITTLNAARAIAMPILLHSFSAFTLDFSE